jgi:hypothetical protein
LNVRQISWWLEWPAGSFRIGVVFLVAVTAMAVVLEYPAIFRDAESRASNNSSLSFADRDVAGGNALVADQAAVYEARGRIPEDATYHVAVGDEYAGGSDLTVPFVASFYRYFLMPRRQAEKAPWLICYGCDIEQYGSRAEVVWQSPEGIAIARIDQ